MVSPLAIHDSTTTRYDCQSGRGVESPPSITSMPPIQGRRTSGTTMEPSACW